MTFADAETGDLQNFQAWLAHRNNGGTAFHYATANLDGKVIPTQRKEGSAEYAYLAIKRRNLRKR